MGDPKRTRQVLVRLTEEEHETFRTEAAAQGRELAQHLRWLATEGRKAVASRAERHPRAAALTPADVETIRSVLIETFGPAPERKRGSRSEGR